MSELKTPRKHQAPDALKKPAAGGMLQRKCACGNHTTAGAECRQCEKDSLQRKSLGGPKNKEVPPIVHEVLRSPGRPLDKSTREFFEPRFNPDFSRVRVSSVAPQMSSSSLTVGEPTSFFEQEADRTAESIMRSESGRDRASAANERQKGFVLSGVRIHTDARAAESARSVNALAYTVGNDIVFGEGQFAPQTYKGRRLIAHELTHVFQQGNKRLQTVLQRDFAVEPTAGARAPAVLNAAQIAAAITFNQGLFTDPDEISNIRDILGLNRMPADIDADFVQAVARYQAGYGLTEDGKLGRKTVEQLSREVIAEGSFLGPADLGSLGLEFRLRDDLLAMVTTGNTTYAAYKAKIVAASPLQKNVALLHEDLLIKIRDTLTWNNFARCIELLGRKAPTYWEMVGEAVVRTAVRAAWNDSNVAVPGPGTTQHEEGGWVYMNLINGSLSTRRAARGAGAAINLTAPPLVADSIVVAKFHSHPNLGPGWVAGPSPRDITNGGVHGVPGIVAGTNGVNRAVYTYFHVPPGQRRHLAGNRGLAGAGGGLAPQAKEDGTHDEE